LVEGVNARLSDNNIMLGGTTGSDGADAATVDHDRKTAWNGHEGARPCR
jgi:hypothetical protein